MFYIFLLVDGRIRILEAQKLTNHTDPEHYYLFYYSIKTPLPGCIFQTSLTYYSSIINKYPVPRKLGIPCGVRTPHSSWWNSPGLLEQTFPPPRIVYDAEDELG
jgi:hypothetical protein